MMLLLSGKYVRELGRDQAWIDAQVESFTKMAKNYIFEA